MGDQVHCVFREILPTCNPAKHFANTTLSDIRIQTIKNCIIERGDNFNLKDDEILHYHKDCYSDYTSLTKIKRLKRNINQEKEKNLGNTPAVKKTRRYAYANF